MSVSEDNLKCILKPFPEFKGLIGNIMQNINKDTLEKAKGLVKLCNKSGGKRKKRKTINSKKKGKTRRKKVGRKMKGGEGEQEFLLFVVAVFAGLSSLYNFVTYDVNETGGRPLSNASSGTSHTLSGGGETESKNRRDIKHKLNCVLELFPNQEDKLDKIMKYYDNHQKEVDKKAKIMAKRLVTCYSKGGGKRKKRKTINSKKKRKTRTKKAGRKIKRGGDPMDPALVLVFNGWTVVFVLGMLYHIFVGRGR